MDGKVISIGINAYEANVAKRVGSNLYAWRILCTLEKLTRNDPTVEWTVYLPTAPLFDLPKEREHFQYRVCPPKKFWTGWRLPLELFLGHKKHDVFLSLGHYGPKWCPFPQAICILDLAFLKFPQFFLKKDLYKLTRWTKESAKRAEHIFTISSSAKIDIMEQYGKKEDAITIAYPGVDLQSTESREQSIGMLEKFHVQEKKYFLALGTIQPRKNIISVIKAFEIVNPEQGNDYTLVLAGKSGWLTKEFEEVLAASSQRERIIVTGFVEESEKWELLRGAVASVLVGYYEGFGIPAAESMSLGVRPVVSNTSSLPEVVGKHGILADPYSVEDIARGLREAITHSPTPIERAAMIDWVKQFSWEESGERMLEVLKGEFSKK